MDVANLTTMDGRRDIVLVTGSAGGIGSELTKELQKEFLVIGFDLEVEEDEQNLSVDLTSDESVNAGLAAVRERFGTRIEAVIHLAAYFDFSGEKSPMYRKVNVEGTRRLLEALQAFEVGHFFYSSTMLVHEGTEPGVSIDEESPLGAHWAYPESKLETERTIEAHHGRIPYTLLRLAGVYDEEHLVPSLAHQVQRIYERSFQSHLFSGDVAAGQSFIHSEDAIDAISRAVRRRAELRDTRALLIGEPEVMSYAELQDCLGELIHGTPWRTRSIPKPLAQAGSWLQVTTEAVVPDAIDQGKEPFIKPFMVPLADDHYELDIGLAREKLQWQPKHSLRERLPAIVQALKKDPEGWYMKNKLTPPVWMTPDEADDADLEKLRVEHDRLLRREHRQNLWAHFLTIALGTWLVTSPPILGYESTPMAVSDIVSGALIVLCASLSLSWRMAWARLLSGLIGFYLLFAPLIFWAPTAAAYLNDTLVGALVIGFAMLTRPPIGVSMIARMTGPDVPEGWDYSPSSWTQRLPIIALAFVGLYVSRYLTAYQLGHIDSAWDPFFGSGTERIITSEVSKAWPVPDAGVGAVTYILEILTGLIGSRRRWRTMPWLVILFGVMIVPLGAISIFFIIIQPIVIGTWCTLCLIGAAAMVVQIPYSFDELLATGQFLLQRRRKGRALWPIFLHGDTASGGSKEAPADFEQSFGQLNREIWAGGVNLPWNLVLSIAIGAWLMCTRLVFGTEEPLASSDHIIGALVITVSVTALAEMARPLRFLNVLFGLALIGAPWLLDGGSLLADWAGVLAGLALIALAIPRGTIANNYGTWNRFLV
ncbi:MAG TPA: vitamin K epoxide reductase family protein [Woeseiaceae bacterium]|nr:vitamin K epoxide reductase family protein [Woeseiaceae bacterium]